MRLAGAPAALTAALTAHSHDDVCAKACLRAIATALGPTASAPRTPSGAADLIIAFREAGACEAVVSAAQVRVSISHGMFLENVMCCVHAMADDTACKARFGTAGACALVIEIMSLPGASMQLTEACVAAAGNLVAGFKRNRVRMRATGARRALKAVLESQHGRSTVLQQRVAQALSVLT